MTDKQLDSAVFPAKVSPTNCQEPHNVEVAGTTSVPKSVAKTGRNSADTRAWAVKACHAMINKYAGLKSPNTAPWYDRTVSSYYLPEKGAWAKGDRQVLCGAVSSKPRFGKNGSVAATARGTIAEALAAGSLAMMYWQSKQDGATVKTFMSALKYVFDGPGDAYPGLDKLKRDAQKFCQKYWLAEYGHYYNVSTASDWKKGDRFMTCSNSISFI